MSISLFNGTVSYDSVTNIYSVSTGITTANLEKLLNTANDFATIQFGAGTYILTEQVDVDRGNLTIKGAGEQATVFETHFSYDQPQSAFLFVGGTSVSTTLQNNITAGTKTITVQDASLFHVGDEVRITQANDDAFLHQAIPDTLASDPYIAKTVKDNIVANGTLYGNIENDPLVDSHNLRSSLTVIERIEGNTIYLKEPVAFDMTGGLAEVQKVEALDNLRLSDFTVQSNLPPADPAAMVNPYPNAIECDAIGFYYVRGTEVSNVSILNPVSHGLEFSYAYDVTVDNVTIVGAQNKGDGGPGYGLNLNETQHSTFTDLTILDTRHAVVFGSWGAEVDNTIQIAQTNRDVNYHGGPDMGNVVTIDQSIINNYSSSAGGSVIGSFWTMHPYTDISANTTQVTYAVSLQANDVLIGTDYGAYLRGGAGQDLLIGGMGRDVLIGDTQADTLTGGKGGDYFVFSNELSGWGATDTVTDFNKAEGDKIVFFKIGTTLTTSNIHIVSLGTDTQVTVDGLDSVVVLKNIASSQISVSDIVLNTKPYSDNPVDWQKNYVGNQQDDLFTGTSKAEIFDGGGGNDTVDYSTSAYAVIVDLQNHTASGGFAQGDVLTSVENVKGSGNALVRDSLYGDAGDNKLYGQAGADFLEGGGGADVIDGGAGWDTVRYYRSAAGVSINLETNINTGGDAEGDTLYGIEGVLGSVFSDSLKGGSGNDTLNGVGGNDVLYAGAGGDFLTGGAGADRFVLDPVLGSKDVITDFNRLEDILDLSLLVKNFDPLSQAIADFIQITDSGSTSIVKVDLDGKGAAYGWTHVATLNNVTGLTDEQALVTSGHLIP